MIKQSEAICNELARKLTKFLRPWFNLNVEKGDEDGFSDRKVY